MKVWLRAISILACIAFLGGEGRAQTPTGWRSSAEGAVKVFIKRFGGDLVTLRIEPWAPLGGLDVAQWLEREWGRPHGPWAVRKRTGARPSVIKSAHFEGAVVARVLASSGGGPEASLLFACAKGGRVLLANVATRARRITHKNVGAEARSLWSAHCQQGPGAAQEAKAPPQPIAKRPKFQPGRAPEGLEAIWYIGEFIPSVSGYTASQYSLVAFKDKTITEKVGDVFAMGAPASKRKSPNQWGVWRLADGDLEVKWRKSKSYRDFYLTRRAEPLGADFRLQGCFRKQSGAGLLIGGANVTSVAIKRWCFDQSGSFTTGSTVSVVSGGPGVDTSSGGASSGQAGFYRIDGNVIQLRFLSGEAVTTAFALFDADDPSSTTQMILGASHYRN